MVRHTGEYFIDVEGIAVTPVLALQVFGHKRTELDTPETDCFTADGDASFSEEIFNIAVAEIKSIVEPDGVADDIGRKSVTFIGIHPLILARISSLTCQQLKSS